MSIPLSKQFVYDPYADLQWGGRSMVPYFDVVKAAKVQGYDFTRANTVPMDFNVYDVATNAVVCNWNDLPEETPDPSQLLNFTASDDAQEVAELVATNITERVMAYLADPDRSERTTVWNHLVTECFFDAADDSSKLRIVQKILAYYDGACAEGAGRAREALGLTDMNVPEP